MGKFTRANVVDVARPEAGQTADQLADIVARQMQGQSVPIEQIEEATITPDNVGDQSDVAQVGAVQVQSQVAPASDFTAPEPTGTPEQLAEIQERGHMRFDEQTGQVREATPEETQEDYIEELKSGRRDFRFYDPESGEIAIPRVGMARSSQGVAKLEVDMAKFANAMAGLSKAEAKKAGVGEQAYGAFSHAPVDVAPVLQKLGIAEAAGGSKVRPNVQAAGVAYLAFLAAAAETQGGATVIRPDKETGEVRELTSKDEPMQRHSLNRTAADILQRLVQPSTNVDPNTGVASGPAGYQPATPLSNTEQQALGDFIVNSARASGLINTSQDDGANALMAEKEVTDFEDGKKITRFEYFPTEYGVNYLNKMAGVLEEVAPDSARPVSLVPNPGGKAVGSRTIGHDERTKVPDETKSPLPPQVKEALDVLGRTPNMVNHKKLAFMEMAFQDTMQKQKQLLDTAKQEMNYEGTKQQIMAGREYSQLSFPEKEQLKALDRQLLNKQSELAPQIESPYATMFNQDHKSFVDNINSSERENQMAVTYKREGDRLFKMDPKKKRDPWIDITETSKMTPEQIASIDPNGEPTTMRFSKRKDNVSHYKFASKVREAARKSTEKTLSDAGRMTYDTNPDGSRGALKPKVFYYQGTVIGNSGRIMVSNTELNYQANKLARFLVDNPKPVVFKKGDGSAKERGFRYVLARNLIPDADKMTEARLMENFKQMEDTIGGYADQLYEASQVDNPSVRAPEITKAFARIKGEAPIPQDWEMSDEWGFTLDALVDLGKYRALSPGQTMSTRVKAEGDGINNGSSIQGLQFGTKTILERAGVTYDAESGSVLTNEETMRDYLFKVMMDVDQSNSSMTDDEHTLYESLMGQVQDFGLKKKLVKIPLMVTIYGKPFDRHSDHLRKFVNDNAGADKLNLGTPEAIKDAVRVLDKGLQAGLMQSLNEPLIHQSLVKQVSGWLLNAIEEIPEIEGANGYYWQSGTTAPKSSTRLAQTPAKLDEEGVQTGETEKRSLTVKEFGPDPLAAKDKDGSPGSALRNQLAVNGTHNIDSTIAQETMVQLQKEGKWGHQVFDAFVGDAESFGRVMEIGNEKFLSVNRRYNLLQKELEAHERAVEAFRKRIDESTQESFDLAGGDLPGFTLFLNKRLASTNKAAMERNTNHWVKPLTDIKAEMESLFPIEFDKKKGVIFKEPLNKAQIKSLYKYMEDHYGMPEPGSDGRLTGKVRPTKQIFQKIIENVNRQRKDFWDYYEQTKPRVRQYN